MKYSGNHWFGILSVETNRAFEALVGSMCTSQLTRSPTCDSCLWLTICVSSVFEMDRMLWFKLYSMYAKSSLGIFRVSFICLSVYHPACTFKVLPVSSVTSLRTLRWHSSCSSTMQQEARMVLMGLRLQVNTTVPLHNFWFQKGPCSIQHFWKLGSVPSGHRFPDYGSGHTLPGCTSCYHSFF